MYNLEDLLNQADESCDKLFKNEADRDDAEINYESIFAQVLVEAKNEMGSTLADKYTRGDIRVTNAKAIYLEKCRLVEAGKRKLIWLQEKINAEKYIGRSTDKLTGG